MNLILLTLLSILSSYSSPMEKMEKRLSVYNEAHSLHCISSDTPSKDEGLYLDVTCQFNCAGKKVQKERVRGAFIPGQRGLFPGNGSTEENPIWSSVGVSMKVWVQEICLEKAYTSCKSYQYIESLDFEKVESGDWVMNRFPGCQEKDLTLSPFNNSLRVNRFLNLSSISEHIAKPDHFLIPGIQGTIKNTNLKNCQKKIKGAICFGDCVDLASKEYVETLATKEPLGTAEIEVCGDELSGALSKTSVTSAVRKTLCDSFFWNSIIQDKTNLYRSCAAIRGSVDCEKF